jgi:rsbT antagonist protein RsbS
MRDEAVTRIPLQVSQKCVVGSIQVDLREDVLRQFRTDLLEILHASGAKGVILDLGGVDVMDLEEFEALRQTLAMASLMGAHTILAGLRPGVASALVELDARVEDIHAALDLDRAFEQMQKVLSEEEEIGEHGFEEETIAETDSCQE